VLAKSLIGGTVTGDIMEGIRRGAIPFVPVRGYRPETTAPLSIELGQAWAFYKRFYPAHGLDVMSTLLAPELGVGSGAHFPVIILLHNATDKPVTFHLHTQLPAGWGVDSTSSQHSHAWPMTDFTAGPHDDYPVRVRLVAPTLQSSQWQTVTWTADADGQRLGPVALRIFVGGR
jgi:hypothetical protein